MSKDQEQIIRCGHCGNKTMGQTLFLAEGEPEIIEISDYGDMTAQTYFYLVKCKSCAGVSLFTDWSEADEPGNLSEAVALYPKNHNLTDDLPSGIAKTYAEAKKVFKISHTAFAVLIRKSLEYIMQDQKADGATLERQLEDLSRKGVIPKTISDMSHALRYLGNISAHASNVEIGYQEAKTMDELFLAIVDYVYVAPNKIKKIQEFINKSHQQV